MTAGHRQGSRRRPDPHAERNENRLEPDTGPAYFAYDAAGNRTMMQDGSGTTYWSYDALNRMTDEEAN